MIRLLQKNSPAVLSKARAMYGKRITPAQFDEMLRCTSVVEVAAYLKGHTHYQKVLSGISENDIHRGQLEELLRRAFLEECDKLFYYQGQLAGTQFDFFLQETEIQELMRMVLLIRAGKPEHFIVELPQHLMQHGKVDFLAFSQVKTFRQLVKLLQEEHTYYGNVLEKFVTDDDHRLDIMAIEHALWQNFYERVMDSLKSSDHETQELEDLIRLRIELLNLCNLYRNALYLHLSPEQLKDVLLPWGIKIKKQALLPFMEARGEEAFTEELKKVPYYARFELEEEETIEHFTDRIFTGRCRHLLHFTENSDLCFYAYLLLSRQEERNVVTLLEGIRYGMAPEQIRKLLIL